MREIMTNIKKPELVAKRREQIMQTAMILFRKNGYHATTMREICQKSKVNRGSFYDYFRSKEDILVYIYQQMLYLEENFERIKPEVIISEWKDLAPYIKTVLSTSWKRNKHRIQLMYRETISLDPKTIREVMGAESKYIQRVAENLRKGLGLPVVSEELEILANTMVFFNAFIPLKGWNMTHLDQEKVIDLVAETLLMKLKKMKNGTKSKTTMKIRN
jgi:AcrR family transcriptional regulator